ncbi:MAG: lipopolysaccharide biosynthesis protein [bacterium]
MGTHHVKAVRHAAWLMVQRTSLVASGILYAAIVPRLMGPETYGRYAVMMSLSVWFYLMGELGLTQSLARFLPERAALKDEDGIKSILGSVLALRLTTGLVSALAYFACMSWFLDDMHLKTLAVVAAAVFVGAAGELSFSVHLGLNRAARWGISFVIRRWAYLLAIPLGYRLGGLTGAASGAVATELLVMTIGYATSREHFSFAHLRVRAAVLKPILRFGVILFAGNMILSTFRLSGEALVRLANGDYEQVGFFGLSMSIFIAAESGIVQLGMAFTPLFTSLALAGDREALSIWVERLMRGLTVLVLPVVFGALLLADHLVPLLFGAAFRPAAPNMLPLTMTLAVLIPGTIAGALGLALTRPGVTLIASAVRLAGFWGAGFFLVRAHGSLGGCLAALGATIGYSAAMILLTRRLQPYTLRRWALAILVATPVAPLAWCKGSRGHDIILFLAGTAAYGGLVFATRVISWSEIRSTFAAVSGREVSG